MSDPETLSALDEVEVELEHPIEQEKAVESERPYFFQLDVLKAIAIIFVVMDHSLSWDAKSAIGSLFWERLSIPFFLIVMGFNMGYSFKYHGGTTLRELYSLKYFKHKIVRYVLPFAVLYMGSILVGIYFGALNFDPWILLGYLPFWGPGNWFIPLLFGSIVVFPLIYWMFKKQPVLTMIFCFLSEIILQGIMYFWFPYPIESVLEGFITSAIRVNVFFFLPAVGLGLWFSEDHNLFSRRNWFMFAYLPISLVFMIDYTTGIISALPNTIGQSFTFIQDYIRGDYTLLFYGYAAIWFLFAMIMIPKKASGSLQRFIQRIGRASYHILLFQIIYYSIVYYRISPEAQFLKIEPEFATVLGWSSDLYYIPFYLINLTICLAGGLLWMEAEKRASAKGKPWWQHIWMKRTGLLFCGLMTMPLMGVSLELIAEYMGLNAWARNHGPFFVLNEYTGPGFMASFIAILFFIGLCMLFMYKAFTMSDDEIPI